MVSRVKRITTRKGDRMAFVSLMRGANEFDVTVFPQFYQVVNHVLSKGRPLLVRGERQVDRNGTVVAKRVMDLGTEEIFTDPYNR